MQNLPEKNSDYRKNRGVIMNKMIAISREFGSGALSIKNVYSFRRDFSMAG